MFLGQFETLKKVDFLAPNDVRGAGKKSTFLYGVKFFQKWPPRVKIVRKTRIFSQKNFLTTPRPLKLEKIDFLALKIAF